MTLFFYGPNTYEMRQQLGQMVQAYQQKNGTAMGLDRVDGPAVSLADFMAVITAAPFLTNSRLVVVEDITKNKALATKLPECMAAIPRTSVVIFVEQEVDQRTVVFKSLRAADKVMKFDPLPVPQLLAWVKRKVASLGGTIDHAVARELVERAGTDQWRLSNEIRKLVDYDPDVRGETIRSLVQQSSEQSIFDLVDSMTAGRLATALNHFRGLLAQKESEIYILTMIQWQLRNVLILKLAPNTLSPPDVALEAGISTYVAGKAAGVAQRLEPDVVIRAFEAAVNCEYQIKSGKARAEVAVEQLIIKIAGETL